VHRLYLALGGESGGPIGLIRDGDIIAIDARDSSGILLVELDEAEFEARRALPRTARARPKGGVLEKYAAAVGPANKGAVTHSGNVVWEMDA